MATRARYLKQPLPAFDPDPTLNWLFIFAHPDDELGLTGWVSRLSGRATLAWAHATPARRREAEQVAGLLGARAEFGPFGDGEFVDRLLELRDWVHAVYQRVGPDRLVVTAFQQGHLDHDALAWAAAGLPRWETPLYHHYGRWLQIVGQFPDPAGQEVLHLTPRERNAKWDAVDLYPSQSVGRNLRLLKLLHRNSELDEVERLRPAPAYDFSRPLISEAAPTREWRRWQEALHRVAFSRGDARP